MQHLKYAFRFINACIALTLKHRRLRSPLFHLWMGGMALIILWLVALLIVVAFFGTRPLGLVLIGVLISLLLFCLLAWGEITALETCLIFDDLTWMDQGLPGSSQGKQDYARWYEVLFWVFLQPGFWIIRLFNQAFRPQHVEKSDWLSAAYLMLPIMTLESFRLREAIDRIKQLVANRLIRFRHDLVAVRPLSTVVQGLFILLGAGVGLWVGLKIADFKTARLLSRLIAVAVGTLIAGVLTLLGTSFSSFNRACYYTTLYQWILSVENARMMGDPSHSPPPEILSQVMKTRRPNPKEK